MQRRNILSWPLAALAASAAPRAFSQNYPSRPVKIVCPFAAGGGTDLLGRMIAKRWSERTGQPFVVENPTGAGGNIGVGMVARAPADGHTLLMSFVGAQAINPTLYKKLNWAPEDIEPIAQVGSYPYLVLVNPNVPARNFKELIEYGRANPGRLNYGSPGTGSGAQLLGALMSLRSGAPMTHVPYRGSAPMVQDLLAGNVQLAFDTWITGQQFVKAGRLKVLAVTSDRRLDFLPDVPTVAEQGYKALEAHGWFGLFAPSGIPEPTLGIIKKTATEIIASKDFQQEAVALGAFPPQPEAVKDFKAFVNSEITRWADVVRISGATAE